MTPIRGRVIRMKTAGMLALFLVLGAVPGGTAERGSTVTVDLGKNISATIIERPFDGEKRSVERCHDGPGICRIDGGTPFGVAAGTPDIVLAKLSLGVGGRNYDLDTSNMYNPGSGRRREAGPLLAAVCYDSANCVVRGIFSDGVAVYVAEWAIVDGKSSRTILTGSNDVVELFRNRLAPPSFE
jgi:hypothetical protein